MKILYGFLITLLISLPSLANKCGALSNYNVVLNYEASEFALEPAFFTVKEGDRICIRFKTIDSKPKNLRMQQAYFWLKAYPGKPEEFLYVARKQGQLKVTCTGCEKGATLIIEDPKTFEAREKKMYERNSHKNRSKHYYQY